MSGECLGCRAQPGTAHAAGCVYRGEIVGGPRFIEITPATSGYVQVLATDLIARIYKEEHEDGRAKDFTVIRLRDGTSITVDESIKTLQARLGIL